MAKLADNPTMELFRCGSSLEVSHYTVAEAANPAAQCGYMTSNYRRIGLGEKGAHAIHIPHGIRKYRELVAYCMSSLYSLLSLGM